MRTINMVKRVGIMLAVSLSLIAGISSPAFAGNTNIDVESGGHIRGSMTHVDDGDTFRVTDWYADGYGVLGCLYQYIPRDGAWKQITCKWNGTGAGNYVSFQHNVLELLPYRMTVCVKRNANDSASLACKSKDFNE